MESELVRRKVVAISGGTPDGRYDRLFEALGQLYPVEFRRVGVEDCADPDGLIVLDGDVVAGCVAADRGTASYVVVDGGNGAVKVSDTQVRLGKSPLLDERLRDQVVHEEDVTAFCPLAPLPGDVVLASKGGHPIWLERPAGRGGCQLVALAPPVVGENEYLVEYFHGRRYLRLLPLMNFLRQLTKEVGWQAPTPHACLVLDDPSLYWPTYGFVNFRLLAEHARRHNYFVAVATIPLDSWWVNPGVAAIFRSEHPRLSLIVHGNNHTWHEMLRPGNGTRGLETAAQALRRIDRLDNKYGLSVARIMEPPHGPVLAEMFPHLVSLGYGAALATFELLVRMNRLSAWPATIGLESSTIIAGGLPVIPSIRAYPSWKNDVMLAAFLRQPIAVTVHHQDAAQDMAGLADIAAAVNRLGDVVWSDMRGILRDNYVQRLEGDVLHVRMHSRAVTVRIPAGARQICVHRSWIAAGQNERIVIRSNRGTVVEGLAGAQTQPEAVEEGDLVEVRTKRVNPLHYSSVAQPGISLWPIARKMMMEVRDRLTPALSLVGLGWQSTRTHRR
jgi:hypothetical protein